MIISARTRSRRSAAVLAGAATAALLAGCAGGNGTSGQAAASPTSAGTSTSSSSATSSSAASSSATSSAGSSATSGARQSPLSKGLLPASAFGSQATVASLTLEQLQKVTGGQLGTASDLQVDPAPCASALRSSQVDPNQVQDLVAQAATNQTGGQQSATVEALMTGSTVDGAVDRLKATLANCSHVTASSPQSGQATVQFSPVDVSGIGAPAAAASETITLTPPGHPAVTVPALVGVVQDGQRLLLLTTVDASAATAGGSAAASPATPDPGAFTALLQKAYQTEKQALG